MIRERLLPSINQTLWILLFARASLAHKKWLLFYGRDSKKGKSELYGEDLARMLF